MRINNSKVVVIGAGSVGSATASSLVTQGVCDQVMLLDINREKAYAEALDLRHSIQYLNRNVKVCCGEYKDCGDADIVVVTAAAPMKPGQTRLDMLADSKKIIKELVEPVMESGFDGIFLVITNPVDVISYYIYKLSGLPKSQVIGTGTALDTARLKCYLAELIDVDPRSVHGFCMGEHGDSQMVPWSRVMVGGKSFTDILRDNPGQLGQVHLKDIAKKTTRAGWEIIERKGSTNYGIAASTVGIIKAILNDENKVIPVSTLLDGEYGHCEVFAGVPAVLCRSGVKEVIQIRMHEDEKARFDHSVKIIKEHCDSLNVK